MAGPPRQTPRVPKTVLYEKIVPAAIVVLFVLLIVVLFVVLVWPAVNAG